MLCDISNLFWALHGWQPQSSLDSDFHYLMFLYHWYASDLILKDVKDHQRETNTGTRYGFCMCARRVWLHATLWTVTHQAPPSKGFSRQEYWSGFCALIQEICPTQGPNSHFLCLLWLMHCRQILYPVNHLGSPWYSQINKVIQVVIGGKAMRNY